MYIRNGIAYAGEETPMIKVNGHGYERDFSKHAPKDQVARIRLVWQTLPSQLFKENKKFIYGSLKHGARAKDFEIAIQCLVDAGLVYKVPLCKEVKLPLKVYEDPTAFKLFTLDLGLLGAMVGTEAKQVLIKNDIFSEYKGGMTEQYVFQLPQRMLNQIPKMW